MAKFGKWIGAGLGWAFGGPIGGLLGFAVGSMFDATSFSTGEVKQEHRTTTGDFVMSLLVLVAAMMKADGRVTRSELNYVKSYFIRSFGEASAREAVRMLGDLVKQNIPVGDVSRQIRKSLDYSSRLQLLHFLYGISQADQRIHPEEIRLIDHIAVQMGISEADRNSIKSMFVKSTDAAYKILEIDPSAHDEEVKKAYRKIANKYHPDKVSYLGEEFKEVAHEKFQKVNEAYNVIKEERGIS